MRDLIMAYHVLVQSGFFFFVFEIMILLLCKMPGIKSIGLLQLAITWYKIGHAGGQAHYYSRNGTLKQRDLNQ